MREASMRAAHSGRVEATGLEPVTPAALAALAPSGLTRMPFLGALPPGRSHGSLPSAGVTGMPCVRGMSASGAIGDGGGNRTRTGDPRVANAVL